ncbi:uncharacterized protein J3R85_008056, partial [Psidium guajava]
KVVLVGGSFGENIWLFMEEISGNSREKMVHQRGKFEHEGQEDRVSDKGMW